MSLETAKAPERPRRYYRWIIGLLLGAAVVWAAYQFNAPALLRKALEWVAGLGPTGMVLYISIYITACLLFLPCWILTVGAGTVFGLVKGTVLTSIGATLGATAAFLISRYLARDWVTRRIEGNPKFKAIDQAVGREGWKIVLLTRLSPIFPFVLLNYAYGLTSVSLRHYFLASWLGMLPVTVVYVYLGSLVRDLANAGNRSGRVRTPLEWVCYGVGLLATIAVSIYVTRIARRALAERIEN